MPGDWTIEQLLEEKKQYDVGLSFEKKTGEDSHRWKLPGKPSPLQTRTTGNKIGDLSRRTGLIPLQHLAKPLRSPRFQQLQMFSAYVARDIVMEREKSWTAYSLRLPIDH